MSSAAGESQKVAAYGRLCVRVCLHVVGKEKVGREPAGFKDLHEIAEKFAEELQNPLPVQAPAASSSSDLPVTNVFTASPAELALVQNQHIKVNELLLG